MRNQGENNCGTLHGNSANSAGYGCLMPKMIEVWRREWSAEPGTTDPLAPFGLVGISTADSEGAADLASFRWSQQANFGVVPNPLMPNVFMARAYDLADPWGACGNTASGKCAACDTADPLRDCRTPFYMGPGIHPRLKKPVGQRLAVGAMATAYGSGQALTGPTISGCTYSGTDSNVNGATLTVRFNATLLRGARLTVQPYDRSYPNRSAFAALLNGTWIPLNIALSGSSNALDIDLTPLYGGVPSAIKYAWGPNDGPPNTQDVNCCAAADTANGEECLPGGCPILAAGVWGAPFGGLPANPFLAKVVGGRCACPTPQTCAE